MPYISTYIARCSFCGCTTYYPEYMVCARCFAGWRQIWDVYAEPC